MRFRKGNDKIVKNKKLNSKNGKHKSYQFLIKIHKNATRFLYINIAAIPFIAGVD
jgi:hypothetical protein